MLWHIDIDSGSCNQNKHHTELFVLDMMNGKYILHKSYKLTFIVNSKINYKIATGPRSHYLTLKKL